MRAVTNYNYSQLRSKKIKSVLLTEMFLREKIFIKVIDIIEQIKLFVVITFLIIKEFFSGLIRGP